MKNSNLIISVLWLVWLSLLSIDVHSKEETYTENLLKRYESLTTYCDSIEQPVSNDTGIYITITYERCYQIGGIYKVIASEKMKFKTPTDYTYIEWSDGDKKYWIMGYTKNGILEINNSSYREVDLDSFYDDLQHRTILNRFIRPGYSPEEWINKFSINRQLSDDEFTVLDYSYEDRNSEKILERLWISNQDTLIIKYDKFIGSEVIKTSKISNIKTNQILTKDDISFSPSPLTKYSLSNHPRIFIPALTLFSYFFGVVLWLILFLCNRDVVSNTIPWRYKRKIWKIYGKSTLTIIVILFVLGVISSLFGGGHPPPIILVIAAAVYCGLSILAVGFFLSGAHPAHWLAEKIIRKRN